MADNWGIYIHVPWCRRRCPYCDFYFEVGKANPSFDQSVIEEFKTRCGFWPTTPASTLYFGGGTPSLLPQNELRSIVVTLKEQCALEEDAEITLEANPEDISHSFALGLKSAGINRVSLGVQSFEDSILKYLGRKHRSEEAMNAVQACVDAGFERISVDIIFGVPNENQDAIKASVTQLRERGVGHVSAYLLTVEPGTALQKLIHQQKRISPDDDNQADAYQQMQHLMEQSGYNQYEVSSYAIAGQESKHNRNYWGKGQYLGLGPGAHSMRFLPDGSVERSKNVASLNQWKGEITNPLRESERLSPMDAFLEAVSFGLRDLAIGVDLRQLSQKHCCEPPAALEPLLAKAIKRGWILKNAATSTYHLSSLGVRFSDAVAREILALS